MKNRKNVRRRNRSDREEKRNRETEKGIKEKRMEGTHGREEEMVRKNRRERGEKLKREEDSARTWEEERKEWKGENLERGGS